MDIACLKPTAAATASSSKEELLVSVIDVYEKVNLKAKHSSVFTGPKWAAARGSAAGETERSFGPFPQKLGEVSILYHFTRTKQEL
jgi:hypothetical protein